MVEGFVTEATVQQIADKLTTAQRRAIINLRAPEGSGKWPVRNALVEKGLFRDFPWRLTSLGNLVRARLTKEPRHD